MARYPALVQETEAFLRKTIGGEQFSDISLPEQVADQIDQHIASLSTNVDARGIEADMTGTNIPAWVQPLHFEKNLNAALDALDALEGMVAEYHALILAEIQKNHILSEFKLNPQYSNDERYLLQHIELSKLVDFEKLKNTHLLRVSQKTVDVVEYAKAAKAGCRILFLHEVDEVPDEDADNILFSIRKPLRELVEWYRLEVKNEQQSIIPIGLKAAKNLDDTYLIHTWQRGQDRGTSRYLESDVLDIDLTNYGFPDSNRIVRVGASVLDWQSRLLQEPNTLMEHPRSWSLEISDNSGGKKLGRNLEDPEGPVHDVRRSILSHVSGSRTLTNISWVNNESIKNVNADRKWQLKVNSAHDGSPADSGSIYDITLFFHIAYPGV